jgi:hypothetical protein
LLGWVFAPVHFIGKSQVAEDYAAGTGHGFTNMIPGEGLRLDDDWLDAFPGKEHCSGRTARPAAYYENISLHGW